MFIVFMHVYIYVVMSSTLETFLIYFLKNPLVQDEFKSSLLEDLLLKHFDELDAEHIEDVIQILHKCIVELEKLQVLKFKYVLLQKRLMHEHVS